MNFNIQIGNQASQIENKLRTPLYHSINETSKKNKAIRFIGFGVGVVSASLLIATRVALIGENLIKGLGNILGAAISNKCSIKKGLNQLFFQVPKHILILPFLIILAPVEIILNTYSFAKAPQEFSAQLYYAQLEKN